MRQESISWTSTKTLLLKDHILAVLCWRGGCFCGAAC